jgi:hypothetical protein
MNEKIINGGDVVICDFCNGGDKTMGGVIVGSSAVCGDCTDRYGYDKEDYEYANEVSEVFDKERSFKDNVLEYRLKVYGTSDAITVIKTF